jgi:Icc-related predicted phosphoesterase
MKILHISDTHGGMPALLPDGDVVVHSGDMLPNKSFANRPIEHAFQRMWIEDNVQKLAAWIGKRPFLYTPGNHDYYDPCSLLRDAGVDARLLCDSGLTLDGVSFWGFPWVNEFCGWNWMCEEPEMISRCGDLTEIMDAGGIDVLVTHGPIFGVLDRNREGTRCGSKALKHAMQTTTHPPKLLLHGHIHEAAGLQGWSRGMVVSNAACTQRAVSVPTPSR